MSQAEFHVLEELMLHQEKAGVEPAEREVLFTPALGRKPEEVVTSDLVAGGFPADVGEGGINLAIPLVSAIEYVYLNQLALVDAYQLVAGFQLDVVAFGRDAYRGLASLFQIVSGPLDFDHLGSFRISGLNDGFLNRGFGGWLHIRHGLVEFYLVLGFSGFFNFLLQGDFNFCIAARLRSKHLYFVINLIDKTKS